jgi:hypothetical protein
MKNKNYRYSGKLYETGKPISAFVYNPHKKLYNGFILEPKSLILGLAISCFHPNEPLPSRPYSLFFLYNGKIIEIASPSTGFKKALKILKLKKL